ncbi:hypothetical protein, partial [Ferroacidibacillus organovorans]|uniref:hypothetical protein n=1 Tax=Ferroacidibacillus organovorans TaxID=1765683 RepID=UPI001F2EF8E7
MLIMTFTQRRLKVEPVYIPRHSDAFIPTGWDKSNCSMSYAVVPNNWVLVGSNHLISSFVGQ